MRGGQPGWLVTGSRWRLAEGKYRGDQVIQRPGQVVLIDFAEDKGGIVIR